MYIEEEVQPSIQKGLQVIFHLEEQNSNFNLARRVLDVVDELDQGDIGLIWPRARIQDQTKSPQLG